MKILLFIILYFSCFLTLTSQTLTVKVLSEEKPPAFANLELINSKKNDTIIQQTDFEGLAYFSVSSESIYDLNFYFQGYENKRITDIKITDADTTLLTVKVKECNLDDSIKPCPIGSSKKHVIRTMPNLHVTYSFANERKELRYAKKLQKQGYRIVEYQSEEVLIYVLNDEGVNLLEGATVCDKYLFCKKHKHLFK